MVSYVLNVDKAGDLKFGRKKCRLHKKDEVVKVAKDYGISTPNKKTVSELCGSLKKKIQKAEQISREEVKKILANQNNVPLAKLYPEAAKKRFPDFFEVSEKVRRLREMRNEKDKKRAAAKKRAEKKALNKKVATNFMKAMTTRIATPTRATVRAVMPMPKPQKKAMPLTKDVARKRIMAMKGLNGRNKFSLVNRLSLNQHSPRRVVRLARELARLR
jgi:hypothetical protein